MISEPGRKVTTPADGVVRINIRHGHDLTAGAPPGPSIEDGPPIRHVALCGGDYVGLKPSLRVQQGDSVRIGQALFVDKRDPDVSYAAPGTGTVVAVRRGARRVLQQLVIRLEDDETEVSSAAPGPGPEHQSRADIVARLAASGLWTALRRRPFGCVPGSTDEPDSIFVTAMDTRPLAANPLHILHSHESQFEGGLRVLSRLTAGTLWLCTDSNWQLPEPRVERLQRAVFAGPHPAGLAGTHIHHLAPVGQQRSAWHIGYQDVLAIGRLFSEGVLDYSRVVAVGGNAVSKSRLLRSRVGAALEDLLAGQGEINAARMLISGSPLDGRVSTTGQDFLGRYHQQVTALAMVSARRRFGWLWRGRDGDPGVAGGAGYSGAASGMLPLERFEQLLAPGLLAVPLLRALMAGDLETAQKLGCLELDEEDLALCAWACPSRCDYGGALRHALTRIERGE